MLFVNLQKLESAHKHYLNALNTDYPTHCYNLITFHCSIIYNSLKFVQHNGQDDLIGKHLRAIWLFTSQSCHHSLLK